MAEYINRDLIVKNPMLHTWKKADLLRAIKEAPTADVVEVVRCKDCIYNEIGSCTHSQKYDEDNYRADYYCADGTPKERGGEK